LTGGIYTGCRLSKILKNDELIFCPFCKEGVEEDAEHMFWHCSAWETLRTEVRKLLSKDDVKALPVCAKSCGIWPRKLDLKPFEDRLIREDA
jgi:hypothetical protein